MSQLRYKQEDHNRNFKKNVFHCRGFSICFHNISASTQKMSEVMLWSSIILISIRKSHALISRLGMKGVKSHAGQEKRSLFTYFSSSAPGWVWGGSKGFLLNYFSIIRIGITIPSSQSLRGYVTHRFILVPSLNALCDREEFFMTNFYDIS